MLKRSQSVKCICLKGALILPLMAFGGCKLQRSTDQVRTAAEHEQEFGRYQEAADEYTIIIDRYPGDASAQYNYATCMVEMGKLSKAQNALEIAEASDPRNQKILFALADVLYKQGNSTRLYQLLRSYGTQYDDLEAWCLLAQYAIDLHDPDTAQESISRAISMSKGQDPKPYLLAAKLAERVGNDPEAIRRLRQAYAIAPGDEQIDSELREFGEIPGPTIALPPGP